MLKVGVRKHGVQTSALLLSSADTLSQYLISLSLGLKETVRIITRFVINMKWKTYVPALYIVYLRVGQLDGYLMMMPGKFSLYALSVVLCGFCGYIYL